MSMRWAGQVDSEGDETAWEFDLPCLVKPPERRECKWKGNIDRYFEARIFINYGPYHYMVTLEFSVCRKPYTQ
jgi:hypothetical protein